MVHNISIFECVNCVLLRFLYTPSVNMWMLHVVSTTDANIMNMSDVMMHHPLCHGCLTLLINTVCKAYSGCCGVKNVTCQMMEKTTVM